MERNNQMMKTKDVLAYIGMSRTTLFRLRREKKIHAYKPTGGKYCLYDKNELDKWLHSNQE